MVTVNDQFVLWVNMSSRVDLGFCQIFAMVLAMVANYSTPREILKSYFDAFKGVPDAPRTIFARHGLGKTLQNGEFELVEFAPLDKMIQAMNDLIAIVGPQKAFEMGLKIVENAVHPPGATDIISAMQILDVGYHLNHLRDGVPMFDPQTGAMVEGIGHYKCTTTSKHRVVMDVDAPYHCDMDRGIIQAWARLFERSALVTHLEPSICRKNRSPRCRYEVSWK